MAQFFARHRLIWPTLATLVVVVGVLVSLVIAHETANSRADQDRRSFETSSVQIAASLRLAIQHEEDLTASARALIRDNPNPSMKEFKKWMDDLAVFDRYPELVGASLMKFVPHSELAAYAKRVKADPAGTLGPNGTFAVVPAGKRPGYCFNTAAVGGPGGRLPPAGLDYCAPDAARANGLLDTRDSGMGAYTPVRIEAYGATFLGVETPIYKKQRLVTAAERRKALIGWFGVGLRPKLILQRALSGHPRTAITMRYRDGQSDVAFSSGKAPEDSQTRVTPISTGWTLRVRGAAARTSIFASSGSAAIAIGGSALAFALGVLLYVLGTGRARALALVSERTRELNHLASHDPLTGLANRTLVLEHAERMLGRNGTPSPEVAAMFVDLDGFKEINDTYGHAAGDRVLKVAGERLTAAVRGQDMVARIGGDEFVVLLDSDTEGSSLRVVAKRMIDSLRQPIELDDAGAVLKISASIGIAVGSRTSVDELVRDADLALYVAKQRGKNRFVFHKPSMGPPPRERVTEAAPRAPA